MAQPIDRYRWQQAICSDQGPRSATARLVLLAVSLHMDAEGGGAWPSQATLAKRTLVSRRSVIKHLEIAERHGWVRRYDAGRNGQGWRLTGYEATVPDAVYDTLPERPWEADPTWQRGERPSPRYEPEGGEAGAPRYVDSPKRGEPDTGNVVNLVHERGEPESKKVVKEVHTNLPSDLNLPSESSLRREGALARTVVPASGNGEADPEKVTAILGGLRQRLTHARIADDTGATLQEVRRVADDKLQEIDL